MTVYFPIHTCDYCPNVKISKFYTADSFENVHEWQCFAAENKRITLHEWSDKKPDIPEWCPLREVKQQKVKKAKKE